jgi:hypothetical protein
MKYEVGSQMSEIGQLPTSYFIFDFRASIFDLLKIISSDSENLSIL